MNPLVYWLLPYGLVAFGVIVLLMASGDPTAPSSAPVLGLLLIGGGGYWAYRRHRATIYRMRHRR